MKALILALGLVVVLACLPIGNATSVIYQKTFEGSVINKNVVSTSVNPSSPLFAKYVLPEAVLDYILTYYPNDIRRMSQEDVAQAMADYTAELVAQGQIDALSNSEVTVLAGETWKLVYGFQRANNNAKIGHAALDEAWNQLPRGKPRGMRNAKYGMLNTGKQF